MRHTCNTCVEYLCVEHVYYACICYTCRSVFLHNNTCVRFTDIAHVIYVQTIHLYSMYKACITSVLHMYYGCMNYTNTTHVLHMYHTFNTHVTHFIV